MIPCNVEHQECRDRPDIRLNLSIEQIYGRIPDIQSIPYQYNENHSIWNPIMNVDTNSCSIDYMFINT